MAGLGVSGRGERVECRVALRVRVRSWCDGLRVDQPKLTRKEGAAFLLGDGGPPVVSYVTFQEATGKTASVANLARRVRKLNLETWLLVCSQLLLQDALDHATTQQQVVNSLPRDVQRRIMRFEGKRILLFPQRLHGVMRAALLYAHRGAPPDNLADHAEDVAMAILEADAFDLDAHRGRPGEARIRLLVISKILRLEGRRRSLPRLDVGRTHRLFVELPGELSGVEEVAHAQLRETFEADAGMTLLRHIAIRFALYARLSNVDFEHEPMLIAPAYFEETAIDVEDARRVLRELSIPMDALREATREAKRSDAFELFDPRPFASRPLIEIHEDAFVPTDPAMMLVRLIGDGIWWRMRLGYRAQRDGNAVFQAAIGRLFETYLNELTSEALGSTVGVFGEAEYGRGALGLDLTIACPEALLAVEAGVQRPHVESMFLAAAPGAFERSVENIIVPRVRGAAGAESTNARLRRDPSATRS